MTPAHTPAHAPLLMNVPEAHAVASLSMAVVQATAVALATGVHATEPDTWFQYSWSTFREGIYALDDSNNTPLQAPLDT
jgi:hypothetical protein